VHATKKGVRQSTARQFLIPKLARNRPGGPALNVDVVVGANVARVLFETDAGEVRAVGVSVTLGPVPFFCGLSAPVLGRLLPPLHLPFFGGRGDAAGPREVRARKEVILSAGSYETPHLLLKSGIGPAAQLRAAGVEPVVDLSGVGQRLQDHPVIMLKYGLGPQGGSAAPKTITKLWLAYPSLALKWLLQGKGMLSSSACDVGYFGASNATYEGRPDLQIHGLLE